MKHTNGPTDKHGWTRMRSFILWILCKICENEGYVDQSFETFLHFCFSLALKPLESDILVPSIN